MAHRHSEKARHVLILASLLGTLSIACDSPEDKEKHRAVLERKQGERYDPFQSEPRPTRFLRTEFHLKSPVEFDVEVFIEEVLDRVRFGVVMDDADPGRYAVVVHKSGDCTQSSKLGPPLELGVHEQPAENADPADHMLGDIEVSDGGKGKARWLTAWGHLRPRGDETLLDRPVAIYRDSEEGLGELVACREVEMK